MISYLIVRLHRRPDNHALRYFRFCVTSEQVTIEHLMSLLKLENVEPDSGQFGCGQTVGVLLDVRCPFLINLEVTARLHG